MDNIKSCKVELHNESYNEVPVHCCRHCLSLKIRIVDGTDYCDECGSTEVDTTNILEWENMYKQKYGRNYINR